MSSPHHLPSPQHLPPRPRAAGSFGTAAPLATPGLPWPRSLTLVTAGPPYVVREARDDDLSTTARMHVRDLPVGLFPRLGRPFVKRWHRAFLDSPHATALLVVHVDASGGERVVGFLVGATNRVAFMRELMTSHRSALLIRGAFALVLRPRLLGRFLTTRLRPYLRRMWLAGSRSRHATIRSRAVRPDTPEAELTAIVVDQSWRGTGLGRELVAEFLRRCSAAGSSVAELATVSVDAVRFYERTGWTRTGQGATFDGLQLVKLSRETNEAEET